MQTYFQRIADLWVLISSVCRRSNGKRVNPLSDKKYCLSTRETAGFTIVELMVSMSLFSVLTVLILMSFINISNIRARTGSMKDSQQKIRVVADQITRMTKEASTATIKKDPSPGVVYYSLTLTYNKTKMGGPLATAKTVTYLIQKIDSTCSATDCAVSLFRNDPDSFFTDATLHSPNAQNMFSKDGERGSLGLDPLNSLIEWVDPQDPTKAQDVTGTFPMAVRIKLAGTIIGKNLESYGDDFLIDTNMLMSKASVPNNNADSLAVEYAGHISVVSSEPPLPVIYNVDEYGIDKAIAQKNDYRLLL
ncbi:MAG: type II secretion system protein [bacterium]